jgi:restriction system protein
MSRELKNSTESVGTVSNVTRYAPEIDALMGGTVPADVLTTTDETVEDAGVFAPRRLLT